MAMTTPAKVTLRAPAATATSTQNTFTLPPLSFLLGTWNVTHSSLPLWKSARNVQITYSVPEAPSSSPATAATATATADLSAQKIDDRVTYQSLSSEKVKTISGIDSPAGLGAWNWRGKGWLMIVGTHWEVL